MYESAYILIYSLIFVSIFVNTHLCQYLNTNEDKWSLSTYEICPEGIQPCNMNNRDIYWRRYKIQETLYIGQCTSVPFKVSTLGPHTVLPIAISCPAIFPKSHQWYEISSLSKVILVLGKARNHRAPHLGCREAQSPTLPNFVDCSLYMFNILRCPACCRPFRMWMTFSGFSFSVDLWSICATLLFALISLHGLWKPSESSE